MAQPVKELAIQKCKPEVLSSSPTTHIYEEEENKQMYFLWCGGSPLYTPTKELSQPPDTGPG